MTVVKTFNAYSRDAYATAIYPCKGENITYPALGLCGEAGEFAEKVKKFLRDHNSELTDGLRDAMVKELGDVLWYINAAAIELGVTLEKVANVNLEKLHRRRENDTIHGDGDDR